MSVQAILSCKLYKANPRKDKIKAALASPVNVELVQQLRQYLGDEYKEVNEPITPDPVSDTEFEESSDNVDVRDTSDPTTSGENDIDSSEPVEDDSELDEAVPGEIRPESEPEPEVKSSTVSKGLSINAASSISEELKGTLNVRQDTAGVERVALKDNEIWIYYNDKMNLNAIMTPVIELLNSASYSYLTFNRLARSDNAVVFELTIDDTNAEVVPLEASEGDK